MAWKKNYNYGSDDDDGASLKFDLRVVRAKLIGQHIADIYEAQIARDYMGWLRHINLLHTAVHHLVDRAVEEYPDLKKQVLEIINKNTNVFLGKSFDPKGVTEVEEGLLELQRYLLSAMESNGVFGKQEDVSGL